MRIAELDAEILLALVKRGVVWCPQYSDRLLDANYDTIMSLNAEQSDRLRYLCRINRPWMKQSPNNKVHP